MIMNACQPSCVFFFLNWIPRSLREFHKVGLKYLSDFGPYYDDIVSHLGGNKV